MQDNLFDRVHAVLNGHPNRRGWLNADCPFCAKEAKRGQIHFSYSSLGFKCWVCGAHGSIYQLAQHLRLIDDATYTPPPAVERPKPAPQPVARWRLNPDKLLAQYRAHPQRYQRWAGYKPLTPETIQRHDFGLGALPFFDEEKQCWYMSKSEWLTVPLYEDSALIGLRGRNLRNNGPKWISATGTAYTLWNVANVRAGSVCWLVENYVDAAWIMQEYPEWSAVAIGGATTWQPTWAERLAARRPEVVIVALDRDLAGQATGEFRVQLEAEWIREHPNMNTKPPAANGPKIANSLRQLGQEAILFKWPEFAPAKADIGWLLAHERKAAA